MTDAWIGIGSNLGDRLGHIKKGLGLLAELPETELVAVSSVYDTAPVGKTEQPRFLNAAAGLRTELEPAELMRQLLTIEDLCGRHRREKWGPRELDLDLLLYGEAEIDEDGLRVPHPRAAERTFVLVPLAEIAPDLVFPGTGENVGEMLARLPDADEVKRVGGPPTPA